MALLLVILMWAAIIYFANYATYEPRLDGWVWPVIIGVTGFVFLLL